MIRPRTDRDIEAILDIWLQASIKAHDFVPDEFWEAQVEDMRTLYIPASDTFVFEQNSDVVGFYSLHEDRLAAILCCRSCRARVSANSCWIMPRLNGHRSACRCIPRTKPAVLFTCRRVSRRSANRSMSTPDALNTL